MKNILVAILFFMPFCASAEILVPNVAIDSVLSHENVIYTLTQDNSNIYLNISTSDQKTMMSTVRLGVTVFFDIKGKKKKNVFVKYPSESMSPDIGRTRERNIRTDIHEEESSGNRIKEILENEYSQKAEYGYFDEHQEFNILLTNFGIEVAFAYDDSTNSIAYNLTIPKTRINADAKKDLSKLTVGVETVKDKKKDNNGNGLNGNVGGLNIGRQQGGQGRGGRSGGQGGRGGGARGGQGGGRPNSEGQTRPAEVPLDFWFDVNSGT